MHKFFTTISLIIGMVLLNVLTVKVNAQPNTLVSMNQNLQQMIDFYIADTILVVLPDNYTLSETDATEIRSFVFWKRKPVYEYKHESDLVAADMNKHQHFFGPAYKFRNQELLDTPFIIDDQGFIYDGIAYHQPEDAFYFMNALGTRLYTCRNGENHPLSYVRQMVGAYQLYVFSGSKMITPVIPAEMEQRINSMVWFQLGRIAVEEYNYPTN